MINRRVSSIVAVIIIVIVVAIVAFISSKKAKRVDLVMFMGQSNMAGRGDASISTVVPEGHGYEFRAISDPTKLYPVEEPFGVDENNMFSDVYETTKTGSLVSAFIEEYYQQRKVPIVGVSCSKGGTGLDFWVADGAAIEDAIERHDAARTWLEENGYIIENDFMVWCQGETDGGRGMDAETYATGLTDIIEKMVSEAGIDFCAVIRIGHARDNADRHIQIIEAQTELCKTYDKAVLVSTKFAGFGAEYMKDEYHYTQPAYNEVGKEAGMNTGRNHLCMIRSIIIIRH